jgi:hypothetical protein
MISLKSFNINSRGRVGFSPSIGSEYSDELNNSFTTFSWAA